MNWAVKYCNNGLQFTEEELEAMENDTEFQYMMSEFERLKKLLEENLAYFKSRESDFM